MTTTRSRRQPDSGPPLEVRRSSWPTRSENRLPIWAAMNVSFFYFIFINGAFFRLVGVGCVRGKTRFYFFLNNKILDSNQIVRRKNRVARSTPPARTRSPRYRMKVGRSALFLLDSLRAIIPIVSRCIKTNNRMEMTAAERYGARVRRPRRARRFRILCVCLLLP